MTIPPTLEAADPPSQKPIELSLGTRVRLRRAGSWSRLVAVVSFGVAGIIIAGYVAIFVGATKDTTRGSGSLTVDLTAIVMLISLVGGGVLLWGYSRNIVAFFRQDDAALTRAFRNLRYSWKVWTFGLALLTLMNAIWVLSKF